ncbi:ABC transporter permease subunit [Pelagibacterium sp. 26DY04]|uniref:ABC transporter permease n=1 Tax=Pelagibacterium sp. 26DY04 TaxID=2967130 RepID=UPI002815A263|nr:ABC transporter permease subunit [Pelagibacterium sp. 26DY04]WMT86095.1 ABC transporter permease subunit [Pelagibacterium sp. 26DY04]
METLSLLWREIAFFAQPALYNIYFALASLPIGFGLALLVALGKNSGNPIVRRLCSAYVYAFRGSPIFIQLFMFYSIMLALNPVLWRPWGINWLMMNPLFIGPLALVMNTTAYTAEILYGALRTVPRGELEAARAFGMSPWQVFRTVTWPNMIRIAWPAYTNEVVFLFHATALIYLTLPVIDGQRDIMNAAQYLFERDFNAFLHFPVAALWFLGISLVIFFIFGRIYERLMRHMPKQRNAAPPRLRFRPKYIR